MNIISYSNDGRIVRLGEYIEERFSESDLNFYLLPIPTARDGKHITGKETELSALLSSAREGDVFVGYDVPETFIEAARARGIHVFDAARDLRFIEENARLTAEGTLARLMSGGRVSVTEMKVGVIGLGRIGGRLVRMLSMLGTKVTAFSSKTDENICAEVIPYREMQTFNYKNLDVLINTAPTPLIDGSFSDRLRDVLIIELASGNNIEKSIPFERYAAVPSAMYPESAARAYVEFFGRCADLIF